MTPKPWYTSRAIWANLALLVLAILVAVARGLGADVTLPPEWQPVVAGLVALVNLLLRLTTSQPIGAPPVAP